MAKAIYWIQHAKNNNKKKTNNDKDRKVLDILTNNAICEKTIENLRNIIDVKLVNNEKTLFKRYIKTKLYVAQNVLQ